MHQHTDKVFYSDVLTKVFNFLEFPEVASVAIVNSAWHQASFKRQSCSKACVNSDDYLEKLRWISQRSGIKDLSILLDLRRAKQVRQEEALESIFSVMNSNKQSLQTLEWNLPMNIFRVPHARSPLWKHYMEKPSDRAGDRFVLPNLHSLHFRQTWDSWRFELPALKHLSFCVTGILPSLTFDRSELETVDFGSDRIGGLVELLRETPNLRHLCINLGYNEVSELNLLWESISHLHQLETLVLWQEDDYGVTANEIFGRMILPNDTVELVYAIYSTPSFSIDCGIIPHGQKATIYAEDECVVNATPNVKFIKDPNLQTLRSKIEADNLFFPGLNREISEIEGQLYEIEHETFGDIAI